MFERFSREAREAVVGAQEVARTAGSRAIDTRHVLVALVEREGPACRGLRSSGVDVAALATDLRDEVRSAGLDPEALASLGIDLGAVRERADAVFGPGALDRAGRGPRHVAFTSAAKKALRLALRETIRLDRKSIDGGGLLLGILRADCPARDSLTRAGVDLEALRRALEQPDAPGTRSA